MAEYDGTMPLDNKKHELFVQNVVSGLPDYVSYQRAGYCPKSDEAAQTCASRLLTDVKIKLRLKFFMGEHKEKALWSRERAYNELLELISDSKRDGNYNGRLGAIKELNSLDDLYPKDKKEIDLKVSSSDVFAKLKGALKNG